MPEDEGAGDEGAAAGDEPETGPLRRCVVTRERDYRAQMIRFVVAPDRTVVPDLAAKLPGRGIWLSARRDVLDTARTRGAFARAARGQVTVPADLVVMVQAGLIRRTTELLGLARRAGQAVSGFQKAREWLVAGRVGLVIQAADGSPDERARFLSGNGLRAKAVPVAAPLTGEALGAVFSRDHVVHVVIAHGRLAEALGIECNRLLGIAGQDGRMGQTVT
jgi:predicted RNA-binding protein YlxR (DUF448 family)